MVKLISFFKHYWFGLLTSIILFVGFLFFLLVLVSPRQDLQKRGFIPCTEAMAEGMMSCPTDGKVRCVLGYILENTWCDMRVVGKGLSLWLSGEQKTPWSNYIFTPELEDSEDTEDEELIQFRKENPHLDLELEYMKKLNKQLEETNDAVELPTIVPQENEDKENEQK